MTDERLAEIQRRLIVKKDPSIVQSIDDADLRTGSDTVFAVLKSDSKKIHRDVMSELGYSIKLSWRS